MAVNNNIKSNMDPNNDEDIMQLSMREKRYLLAVERGNISSVKKILRGEILNEDETDVDFNRDCTDPLGRSALTIAIENENIELVMILLAMGVEPKDALLHAISEDYVEAVEVLLDYEEVHHKPGDLYSWQLVTDKQATWTPDVTPLILAAHRNNYEILKLLLDRGATLPMPHDIKCGCDECTIGSKNDSLRHSRSRINAYASLASPSLISLTSKDPLLTAFELSWELRHLSIVENEFKEEYTKLRLQVEDFACELLNHVRSSKELEIMLNFNPEGAEEDGAYDEEHDEVLGLQRLKLAIEYKQKKFVAHANVQQLLTSLWYTGMSDFRRKTSGAQCVEVIKIGCMFPLSCLTYLLAPHSVPGSKLKQPFVKFIVNSSSYGFFLFLLVIVSQKAENMIIRFVGTEEMIHRLGEWEKQDRGAIPSYIEMLIMVYVLGFIWAEIRQFWDAGGMQSYAKDKWNMIDFAINFLYSTWICLRIVSWIVVQREVEMGLDPYIPREAWDAWDPMLLSEGVFGAGTIFSILRLIHIFSVNPHLGPLQISLGRMIHDIMKFLFFYTLVIFAFGCGMNQLLWYYADIDKEKCYQGALLPNRDEAEHSCSVWRRFANPFETSQSLFWASFGLVDLNNFELTGIKSFTRFWAMLMFGSYSTVNVVVLLNLLVAMMSNSYSTIVEKSDTEWKFARTTLWISYFESGGTLPPPFNIIPSLKSFVKHFTCCSSKKFNIDIRKSMSGLEKEQEHCKVMKGMIKRYITARQKMVDEEPMSKDDVNEIQSSVSTFKYELLDVLDNNGMNLSCLPKEWRSGSSGKIERAKERWLMKGFNIGLVEGVNFEVASDKTASNALARIIMKVVSNSTVRRNSKKDWNDIVAANAPKVIDHIGIKAEFERRRCSRRSATGSTTDRRGPTILPTGRGWKKVAHFVQDGYLRSPENMALARRRAAMGTGWRRVGSHLTAGAFRRYNSMKSDSKTNIIDPAQSPTSDGFDNEGKMELKTNPNQGQLKQAPNYQHVDQDIARTDHVALPLASVPEGVLDSSPISMSSNMGSAVFNNVTPYFDDPETEDDQQTVHHVSVDIHDTPLMDLIPGERMSTSPTSATTYEPCQSDWL